MARPLRIEYSGAVYHVTSRGNERGRIFHSDYDRKLFLTILEKVTERFHWLCHVYCLMDNHYHLIVETPEGNLSAGMRQLNGVYTQASNRINGRVGHIFQGRFNAVLVQKETHLLEACRYVVLNPVRAKVADSPENWKWSSYRATAGMEKPHECLVVDWVLVQFDENRQEAERKYREFIKAGIGEESIWEKVKRRGFLGDEEFTERLGKHLVGKKDLVEIPRIQRHADRPSLGTLFKGVKDIEERNRLIAEAVEKHGYRQSEVAEHIGIHYSTVSKIVAEHH
jgi:REP element-mobilizing transposase RayT